jgi:hypothetical protein
VQQAGVGDKFHPGGFGGVNDVAVLDGALADFAGGDQQQFIHALQRGGQRRFIAVVGLTNHNALLAQRFGFGRVAHNRHNLAGRDGFNRFCRT